MTRFLKRLFSDEALAAFLRAESGVEAFPQWERPEPPAYTPAAVREPEEFIPPTPLAPRPLPMPEPIRPLVYQPKRVNWARRLVAHIPAPKPAPWTAEDVARKFIKDAEAGTLRLTHLAECTKILHEFPRS